MSYLLGRRVTVVAAALLCAASASQATLVNRGAKIVVSSNTVVRVGGGTYGDFINQSDGTSHGTVKLYGTLFVDGDFNNSAISGTTFSNDSTGTVNLNGSSQAISGSNSFPSLSKTVTSADTLTFGTGSSGRTIILGTLTLQGASGQLLSLRSATSGARWEVDPRGTRTLGYLSVQDSDNVNGSVIDVSGANCTDAGNNDGWLFTATTTYTVTFTVGANGSISGTTPQTVTSGSDCAPVTAVPDNGYQFVDWTGDYSGTDNPLTIHNVTTDMNITANFSAVPPGSHTVTFLAGTGGSINGTASQTVADGADCTAVTAVPDSGYAFVNWTGDVPPGHESDNPLTVTNVVADMTVTANFAAATYTVTFTAGSNGTISGTSPQTIASGGDCSPVTAVPNSGYFFAGWTGSYTGSENPLTVTNVTTNMNIIANFAAIPPGNYIVNFVPGANGYLSGTTSQLVAEHANCSPVTAVPDSGYRFANWTGDHSGTENPLTVSDVTANMNITANFELNPVGFFTVTFVAGANGTIFGATSQTVASGDDCTAVTAVPNPGYTFINWTGSYSGTDNPLTITDVVADMTINANFAIPENNVANGRYIVLLPSEIPGYVGNDFRAKPTVNAIYATSKKAGLKVLNKIPSKPPYALQADCAWGKNIALVNLKLFQKNLTCQQNLAALFPPSGIITPLACSALNVTVKDTAGNKLKNVDSGEVILQAPFISRIVNETGADIVNATLNQRFFILGVFFGQKPPSVWLEYPVYLEDGVTVKQYKSLKLKVQKPYSYSDYKGAAGKSCMNIVTAESAVEVLMPAKWPRGWANTQGDPPVSVPHNIVIDNKVGRATFPFKTY